MAFTLPKLPYAYEALEPYIDAETMRIHHQAPSAISTTRLGLWRYKVCGLGH